MSLIIATDVTEQTIEQLAAVTFDEKIAEIDNKINELRAKKEQYERYDKTNYLYVIENKVRIIFYYKLKGEQNAKN